MEQFNFNNELSGKIALVTGGTKGAGKAIAERLLRAGATVVISARNQPWIFGNYHTSHKPETTELTIVIFASIGLLVAAAYLVMRFYDIPVRKYLTSKHKKKHNLLITSR